MGVLIAALVAVAGSVGLGAKEGVFAKGSDTTRQDTYAFERNALEIQLARIEDKGHKVYEVNGSNPAEVARLNSKQETLRARIAAIEKAESKMEMAD